MTNVITVIRQSLTVLALFASAATQAANTTVNVNRYWLEGQEKKDTIHIRVPSLRQDWAKSSYDLAAGSSVLFEAYEPTQGHEVTKWSYGTWKEGSSSYPTVVESNSLTFTYKVGTTSPIGLGVHYDWLHYQIQFLPGEGASGSMLARNPEYRDSVTLGNQFTRTGYNFAGWQSSLSASKILSDGVVVSGYDFPDIDYAHKLVTLTATWTPVSVAVTFDPDGGSVTPKSQTYTYNHVMPEPPVPVREGYDFAGWYTERGGQGTRLQWEKEKTSTYTKGFTVYAYWRAKSWTLTFGKNPGNGVGSVSAWPGTGTYTHGTEVTLTATPATGSVFTEWTDGVYSYERTIVMTNDLTVTARFDKSICRVTFHYYDEVGSLRTESQDIDYGQKAVFPSLEKIDKRPDYHFTKWDHDPEATITASLDINAEYALNTYTIRFERGAAPSGSSYTQTLQVTKEATLTPNRFTWSGYEFQCWECDALKATYEDEQAVRDLTHENDVEFVFTAKWMPKKYTVTFDPNRGTVTPASKKVEFGKPYGELPQPERTGYDFRGWFTSTGGGDEITDDVIYTRTSDQTVYAHWSEKTYAVKTEGVYATVTAPTTGTYDYSIRYSWVLEDDPGFTAKLKRADVYSGTDTTGTILQTVTSGSSSYFTMDKNTGYFASVLIKVEAEQVPNTYTVRFDPGEGRTSESTRPVQYLSTYGGQEGTLPTGTRNGYEFMGWWTSSEGGAKIEPDMIYERVGDQTLYAHWKAQVYTFEFHGGSGASGEMEKQDIPILETQKLKPNEFVKTGYTFVGWSKDSSAEKVDLGDEAVIQAQSFEKGSIIPLYAVWEANKYIVRFYPNGGSGDLMAPQTFVYDKATNLVECAYNPPIESRPFLGWTLDPSNETIAYQNKQIVANLTTEPNGVVNLFAVWTSPNIGGNAYSVAANCWKDEYPDHKAVALTPSNSNTVTTVSNEYIQIRPPSSAVRTTASLTLEDLVGKGELTFEYQLQKGSVSTVLDVNRKQTGQTDKTLTSFKENTPEGEWIGSGTIAKDVEEAWDVVLLFRKFSSGDEYVRIREIKWKPEKWDTGPIGITFRMNDGTEAPADIVTNITAVIGNAIGTCPVASRVGHEFKGWALTSDATEAKVTDDKAIVTSAMTTLYAVWNGGLNPEPTEKDRPVIGGDFAFETNPDFDYVIKCATTLANGGNWTQYGGVIKGDGEEVRLPIPPLGDAAGEDASQYGCKFFKVEVIQRGSK